MNDSAPIEAALAAWQAEQRLHGGYTQAELDELTDHVRSSAASLAPTDVERVQLAAHRVGAGSDLAREFGRVRGLHLGSLSSSPAGLLTTGALLWVFAEFLARGTSLGVMSASLWLFPHALREASFVGTLVSLGIIALLATLLASERRARAISEQLRVRPWKFMGACLGLAILAVAINFAGVLVLTRIASVQTAQRAQVLYIEFLPAAGYTSWMLVPLLLCFASLRAVRRAASEPATGRTA